MVDFFTRAVRQVLDVEEPERREIPRREVTVARVPWVDRRLRFWDAPAEVWAQEMEERRRERKERNRAHIAERVTDT